MRKKWKENLKFFFFLKFLGLKSKENVILMNMIGVIFKFCFLFKSIDM